jgi:hypothetical protein
MYRMVAFTPDCATMCITTGSGTMIESLMMMRAMAADGQTPHEWVLVREDAPDRAIAWFGWSTDYAMHMQRRVG